VQIGIDNHWEAWHIVVLGIKFKADFTMPDSVGAVAHKVFYPRKKCRDKYTQTDDN